MYAVVPPLPTGSGVTPVASHRQRREDQSRLPDGGDTPDEDTGSRSGDHNGSHRNDHPAAAVPPEDQAIASETLFATALLANQLPARPPSVDELRLHNNHGWLPPDSPLRLKDKLI